MSKGLIRDLLEIENFFGFHKGSKNGFANSIEFETTSNSYVKILEEAISKKNFPFYNVSTEIKEVVNSEAEDDLNYRKYILKVSFDRTY